jgi:hypothetical protein
VADNLTSLRKVLDAFGGNRSERGDDGISETARELGMTSDRLVVVALRVRAGTIMLNPSPTPEETSELSAMPPEAIPNGAELEIIREALAQAPPSQEK